MQNLEMSSTENTVDGVIMGEPPILDNENSMSSIPSNDDSIPPMEADASTNQSAPSSEPAVDKPSRQARPIQETLHIPVTAMDIIEYEWPIKSGDRYFLQEQIAELLDVKSFKRKYAEFTRRIVEVPEKEYLQLNFPSFLKTIGEHQMHGLTALLSREVRELMSAEYPSIYSDYQRATVQRTKEELAAKQKELDAIKNDKAKMAELRRKAMQNTSEYNSDLVAIKKQERKYYWDIQTSIIQSPSNRWLKLDADRTRPHPYPCALIHGQYQHYYKRFSSSELRRLPLNSVLDGHHLFPIRRRPSPDPVIVSDRDLNPSTSNPPNGISRVKNENGMNSVKRERVAMSDPITSTPISKKSTSISHDTDICVMCNNEDDDANSPKLICSSCNIKVHTDCIDMPDHMVEEAKSYAWNCIECKKCTICSKPDSEDKMMFCDSCDRGYHTFCVGLDKPPSGMWECAKFCAGKLEAVHNRTTEEMEEFDGMNDDEIDELMDEVEAEGKGGRGQKDNGDESNDKGDNNEDDDQDEVNVPETPKNAPKGKKGPPRKRAKMEVTTPSTVGKKKGVKKIKKEPSPPKLEMEVMNEEIEDNDDKVEENEEINEEPTTINGSNTNINSVKKESPEETKSSSSPIDEEEEESKPSTPIPSTKTPRAAPTPLTATRRSSRKAVPRVRD